jgi:hypothetical protein
MEKVEEMSKVDLEAVNRRTDNTMAIGKTIIYSTLPRKLKIQQRE